MSRRFIALVLGALAAVLLAAGCGAGSKSTSSTTTAAGTTTAAAPTTTGRTPTVAPTTTAPGSPTIKISPSNGAATAFLPAYFTVNADDSLNPPMISGPAATAILLNVTSRAPHPVQVTVASHSVSVAPHGHASARIPTLKPGRYPVTVNGSTRGTLVVGAQPGP